MARQPLLKSLTRGDIKTAINMLRQNRGRSLTTMLGIIIAVVAVILIIGIGQGVKHQVQGQVERLGKDLIMVRPGHSGGGLSASLSNLGSPVVIGGLNGRDLRAIQTAKGVDKAVPLSIVEGAVNTDLNNKSFAGPVIATTSEFSSVLHQRVDYGDFLGADSGSDGRAVIGSAVAATLFGENVPLGHSFTFRGQQFIVSGILHKFDSNPLLGDANFNNAIFVKYSVAERLTDNNAPIYEVLARVKSGAMVDQTSKSIQSKLLAVHGGARDFSVLKQDQSLVATDNIINLLTRFTIGAAAIALFIGGIGIMNIMLVSVTERMHEIGIRKAIGATNRQILSQFVTEAAVLSLIGSVSGFAIAAVSIWLLRVFSNWQPVMPWLSGLCVVIVAALVGIVFGTIPAAKAARKDPIDALRNE